MPIEDYEGFLNWAIEASERGEKMTGYEFHKGAAKAYRRALEVYLAFKNGKAAELGLGSKNNLE